MNEDIVWLLQDLGQENAIDVIAHFLIRNPEAEDKIAAKMGSMLSSDQSIPADCTRQDDARASSLEGQGSTSEPSVFAGAGAFASGLAALVAGSNHKMIFVVNSELGMGRGKQCAQVAHAALGLYLEIQESRKDQDLAKMYQWITMGQKKIVVRGNNTDHLKQLKSEAKAAGIPVHLVTDAGCTQIAPGSKTVLALFGTNEELDKITGSLKLL